MERAIINKIQGLGYDVYMRDESDTYLIYTDGKRLGYLQIDRLSGYSIATVHKPNTRTGTGFGIWQGHEFGKEELEHGFMFAPHWGSDRGSVEKYRDIEHYRGTDRWNGAYTLIAKETGE